MDKKVLAPLAVVIIATAMYRIRKPKITKMEKKVFSAIVIGIVLIALYMYNAKPQETYGDGDYTIYGSESCPWTVKALEHAKKMGHAFKYMDCKSETCPSFVDGFPTLL